GTVSRPAAGWTTVLPTPHPEPRLRGAYSFLLGLASLLLPEGTAGPISPWEGGYWRWHLPSLPSPHGVGAGVVSRAAQMSWTFPLNTLNEVAVYSVRPWMRRIPASWPCCPWVKVNTHGPRVME